jgi:hypothetical protein
VAAAVQIKRPAVFALALFAFATAAAALGAGLFDLSARRAAAPIVIAVDKSDLEDALDDAPWISSGQTKGPVLWLVTTPNCKACRAFQTAQLPRLLDAGIEVRAILFAPRALAAASDDARDVATLLKEREWTATEMWLQGRRERPDETMDPAEQDGLLEWSRQSAERIGAVLKRNDLPLGAPTLVWRSGREIHVCVSGDRRGFESAAEDLLKEVRPGA